MLHIPGRNGCSGLSSLNLCPDKTVATQSFPPALLRFLLCCHVSRISVSAASEMRRVDSDDSETAFWGASACCTELWEPGASPELFPCSSELIALVSTNIRLLLAPGAGR